MNYKRIGLLIIGLAFAVQLWAVKFYSINAMYGISLRETNSICKDNNGFVWASSKNGIIRLTGNNYRIYHLPYASADVITIKLIYENPLLVAYSNNGQIFRYNPVSDRFDLMMNISQMLNDEYLIVNNLLIDDTGVFWIACSSGLYRYEAGKLSMAEEIVMQKLFITWLDNYRLIEARPDGLWLFDTRSLKSECLYANRSVDPFLVFSLCLDKSRHNLWIGTLSNGLFCYDLNTGSFKSILKQIIPKQPVLAIEEITDSTMFIGIDGQGIWELHKQGDRVLNIYKESADNPGSLHGNGVYDIFCDQDKRVWLCTITGGVSYLDLSSPLVTQVTHQINNPNSLVNNDVNCLIEDRWGKMWFATNDGISCRDIVRNHWIHFYNNNLEHAQVFLTLCEDDKGRIWAGSYSSGVFVLDGKTGKQLAHYPNDAKDSPVISNYIFDIFRDSQGDIWVGGVNGEFVCYNSQTNRFRTYDREPIGVFAELSPGQILLGCSYGLLLLDKTTGNMQRILLGYVIKDILVSDEAIWICTNGDGLLRFDHKSGKTEKFNVQAGLPSNSVNSIIYVNGYLWVGTENGICRFNPIDKSVVTYPSIISLSRNPFNYGAVYKLKNGQLAWGSGNGAVIFTPELISEFPSEGRIFFQDLTLSGRSIRDIPKLKLDTPVDSLTAIRLNYTQNTLSLELLPIGITSGSKFSWKMEGFDRDWTYPSENEIITYTNLPSGKFRLQIKLHDNASAKILSERSLSIQLVPPFWRTIWFWILATGSVAGLIVFYFLYLIKSMKQKHTEEKVRFFTNTAHEIRTALTLIKAPVEELAKETNLSESGNYYLKVATKQARQLATVVTQLMDFQKVDIGKEQISWSMTDIVKLVSIRCSMFESLAKSKNIIIVFAADRESYFSAVDETKIEKVIDNLISNAVKYSHPDSRVQVNLKCDIHNWTLRVKDEGIGINRKAQRQLFREFYRGHNAINQKIVGSGIGLLLAKKYVTMHEGKISCESQENAGSVFQIVIPYKKVSEQSFQTAFVPEMPQIITPAAANIRDSEPVSGMHPGFDMKVLIVEDNEDLLNFMHNAIKNVFKVYSAEDGGKAWKMIAKQMPDLVVSDVIMPDMDGFELCRLIKSTFETSHIPVILLTSLSGKSEQLRGLGLGADDYLTKPFDMNLLIQKILTVIRNREAVKEKALKLIRGNPAEPLCENELNDKFVKKMLEVAKNNISNADFDKDAFASSMNVSPSLLYKKIKSLTNQSPTDFIKTVRLDHAMELLQTRQYSITEVSELCGFNSVAYFSTVFTKHFGKSPTKI